MKWESTDLAVGGVVVGGIVILLASFLWLSPALSDDTYSLYTEFDRIDGIGPQANVLVRGYTVGRVATIEPRLGDDGALRFTVELEIQSRLASGDSLRLPNGTIARLMPPPVIGAGFIVLEPPAGGGGGAPLDPGSYLPGIRNTAVVEQVQELGTDVGAEVVQTMTTARALMDSVTTAVMVANATLAQTASAIPSLVRGLEAQLVAAQSLTEDLRSQVNTIAPATAASIDSATLLLADSRRLVQELHGLVNTTAPEMKVILANLDTTSILLNHFVRQVSARPWKALTGVKPPEGLDPPEPGAAISQGSPGDTVPARFRGPRPDSTRDTVPGSTRAGGGRADPETPPGGAS